MRATAAAIALVGAAFACVGDAAESVESVESLPEGEKPIHERIDELSGVPHG